MSQCLFIKMSVLVLLLPISTMSFSAEYQNKNLGLFLKEFHSNPQRVMDQAPYKIKGSGTITPLSTKKEGLEKNWFIDDKNQTRKNICYFNENLKKRECGADLMGRAGIYSDDQSELLTDLGVNNIINLNAIDSRGLLNARLSVKPWSDDYWSITNGVLSYRYADPSHIADRGWVQVTDYVRENPANYMLANGYISILSPAEKYDLLIGDENYSLTKAMLNEGKPFYENTGTVEKWMGICHGWAPAAFMMDRPRSSVNVLAADGVTNIPFFPSDIKALASLLWAETNPNHRFAGGRCDVKNPAKDASNGRVIDPNCFDTNPGTWHKTIVNQIGVSDRSFIIDATYDYEVWNQPIYSYNYKYFNPSNFQKFSNNRQARVHVRDFHNDKFKAYRSAESRYIVGVEMSVQYLAETQPEQRTYDGPGLDALKTVVYRYDLELDDHGNIIGGEWYSNLHPDFLWTPEQNERALTGLDRHIEDMIRRENQRELIWQVGQPVPSVWRYNTIQNSHEGTPMGLIIEGLIERSNR